MKRYDLAVVGAGPAGLAAAIQAANYGMQTAIFDENISPGGQLFKQIHKFFGSKEHKAKTRGYKIGQELLAEAEKAGVKVHLNATVLGVYDNKELMVRMDDENVHYKADAILIATGAKENMIPFDGWTLPGVLGAGAAQTMMNLHGVQPCTRVLMVGSGNVGLVVSYQLLQAGIQVAAVIDAAPRIGGYGVHASKLARTGVPFYLSHTVIKAEGVDHVTGAVIAEVDACFQPIPGTEQHLDVDAICIAVGLSPMSQLAAMAGCAMIDKSGAVPIVDECGRTSISGIFVAGDAAGIEEASSAMITGRIAAIAAAMDFGYIDEEVFSRESCNLKRSMGVLHEGMFSPANKGRNDLVLTDEGYPLSQSLLRKGYLEDNEITIYPGFTSGKGIHPVIECTQNIPCNPCQDACRYGCIQVGESITSLPKLNKESRCTGCGMCVASCSGQAIFLVNEDYNSESAIITIPYEFLPYPKAGELGMALGRDGLPLCEAQVMDCKLSTSMDHTALLTIKVPKNMSMKARFYCAREKQK